MFTIVQADRFLLIVSFFIAVEEAQPQLDVVAEAAQPDDE